MEISLTLFASIMSFAFFVVLMTFIELFNMFNIKDKESIDYSVSVSSFMFYSGILARLVALLLVFLAVCSVFGWIVILPGR